MDLAGLQRKLISAARAHAPGDHVPYAFEKRIMARLTSAHAADSWAVWGRALWRAAAPCVAIMLLAGVWSAMTPIANGSTEASLTAEFETAVFASLEQHLGDNR